MIQFDEHIFQRGWNKPPTRASFHMSFFFLNLCNETFWGLFFVQNEGSFPFAFTHATCGYITWRIHEACPRWASSFVRIHKAIDKKNPLLWVIQGCDLSEIFDALEGDWWKGFEVWGLFWFWKCFMAWFLLSPIHGKLSSLGPKKLKYKAVWCGNFSWTEWCSVTDT